MAPISDYKSRLKLLKTDGLPSIGIVTPSYNSEKTIAEAIESVINNKYPLLDYLVVDGNSKDKTVAVAKRYVPSVRVLAEPDRGQSDAINKGFRLTKGDILGWLNADDILYPGALMEVGEFFRNNPAAVGVYGDSKLIDESGKVLAKSGVQPFDRWRLIHSRNFIEQQSCFFRRDAFEAVGGLDIGLKYVMDWELWIKLSKFGDLFYMPKVLSARRMTTSNKTQSGALKRLVEIYGMVCRYGATWRSPVLLNYMYETLITQARWGSGTFASISRILEPVFLMPFRPWFSHRMNSACFGSYSNGNIPPGGAVVVETSSGSSTLLLKLWSVQVEGVSSYKIKCRVNRKATVTLTLMPSSKDHVEYPIEGLDPSRFNLLEFSSSKWAENYEELVGRNVKVSAKVKWAWI